MEPNNYTQKHTSFPLDTYSPDITRKRPSSLNDKHNQQSIRLVMNSSCPEFGNLSDFSDIPAMNDHERKDNVNIITSIEERALTIAKYLKNKSDSWDIKYAITQMLNEFVIIKDDISFIEARKKVVDEVYRAITYNYITYNYKSESNNNLNNEDTPPYRNLSEMLGLQKPTQDPNIGLTEELSRELLLLYIEEQNIEKQKNPHLELDEQSEIALESQKILNYILERAASYGLYLKESTAIRYYSEAINNDIVPLFFNFPNSITIPNIETVLSNVFFYFKTIWKEPLPQKTEENQIASLTPLVSDIIEDLKSIDTADEDYFSYSCTVCIQSIVTLTIKSLAKEGFYIGGNIHHHQAILDSINENTMEEDNPSSTNTSPRTSPFESPILGPIVKQRKIRKSDTSTSEENTPLKDSMDYTEENMTELSLPDNAYDRNQISS